MNSQEILKAPFLKNTFAGLLLTTGEQSSNEALLIFTIHQI